MFDGQLNSFDMCSMVISGTDWLEVPIPYIFGLFFRPICNGEYPHKSYSQKYGTFTYLHVLDPEDLPLLKNRLNIYGRYLFWPVNDGYMMVIYVICVYIYIYIYLFHFIPGFTHDLCWFTLSSNLQTSKMDGFSLEIRYTPHTFHVLENIFVQKMATIEAVAYVGQTQF